MKTVILAGGMGTRISEESYIRPKPMIEIGGKPILWHIMNLYSSHGINEFVICCGYKGYMIKEFFNNYFLHISDVFIDIKNNSTEIIEKKNNDWKIELVDTGEHTQTAGRIKKIQKYINDTFCMTYGDGLSNVDISKLISCHKSNNYIATVTAVKPPGRFGAIEIEGDRVGSFNEKPSGDGGYINGGFFVLEPDIFSYIEEDCPWEGPPLNKITAEKQLGVFKHDDFWQPMDTLRDKVILEELWSSNNAPWKKW